jgi:hypothetical protein
MVYPTRLLRLVLSGPLYTSERWSTSLSLSDFGASTAAPETVSAGVMAACQALIATAAFSTSQKLDTIKLNEIGVDGLYTGTETVEHIYTSPITGTSGTQPPPQLSLVASLLTGAARGYACRGRMFLPAPVYAVTLAQDGRMAVNDVLGVTGYVESFLNALNTELDPFRVVVASKIGTGFIREVKAVRVGRVVDTVRSRRTSLDEDYQVSSDLTGWGDHGFSGGGGSF